MATSNDSLYESSKALLSEYLSGDKAKNYFVRVSSGTTRELPEMLIRELHVNEFEEKDFSYPVIAYGSLNTCFARIVNFLYHSNHSKRALSLFGRDLNQNLENILADFEPDSLWATPAFTSRIISQISKKSILSAIKILHMSGELLSSTNRKFLKKKIPHAKISVGYGSSEIGTIADFSCKYLSALENTYFHPVNGVTVEIISIDSDGIGEIVVSKNIDNSTNISKYKTGDMGRLVDKRCPCGSPTTFEVLGRKDFDFIKLCGATIRQEEFDRVMSLAHLYVKDYRVEAGEDLERGRLKGKITLKIVPTEKFYKEINNVLFIREKISQELFLTPARTLYDLVKDNLFLPLQIELVKEFPSQHKNIKLKRV